jgi:myosin heavy subunit
MELEVNDLATLPDLNEETLLSYLKARYKHDVIYVS